MKKDTLRVLVSWECNLRCSYCCNNQERFRKEIRSVALDDIDWSSYSVVCITGGEPILNFAKVGQVLSRCNKFQLIVFYTNGLLMTGAVARFLERNGVKAVNVGLHDPVFFEYIIKRVLSSTAGTGLSVRFHVQDIYEETIVRRFPQVVFRFWKMDDCERGNENRVILA